MPINIKIEEMPLGYTAKDVREGEEATLITREFVSSTDVEEFKLKAMEGIPNILLSHIPKEQRDALVPVQFMVALMRPDNTVTLYLDTIEGDLSPALETVPKRVWNRGESLTIDDIADVKRLEYPNITFPPDAGILVLFKVGDRRGLFYDFVPLIESKPREFDVEKSLARFFGYLSQQHLFQIDDDTWKYLFDNQWFPFIALKAITREKLINAAKARLFLDDLLPEISNEVKANCENLRIRIQNHSIFADHSKLLEHALDRYIADDFISSTSIILPRIEGIMRTLYRSSGLTDKPGQSKMAAAAVQARVIDQSGLFILPDKFHEFLTKVYFADFGRPSLPDIVSRHSVSHGVANQADFNQKSATIALLILDQISFFLPDESPIVRT